MDPSAEPLCGIPTELDLPNNTACTSCHDEDSGVAPPPSPTRIAGYDDDQLIAFFSEGELIPGALYSSAILDQVGNQRCFLEAAHTWEMTEDEKRGILWVLRSLTPEVGE